MSYGISQLGFLMHTKNLKKIVRPSNAFHEPFKLINVLVSENFLLYFRLFCHRVLC